VINIWPSPTDSNFIKALWNAHLLVHRMKLKEVKHLSSVSSSLVLTKVKQKKTSCVICNIIR
jgi:hypothetical protein